MDLHILKARSPFLLFFQTNPEQPRTTPIDPDIWRRRGDREGCLTMTQRDERTYQAYREGLPGHQGLSRDEVLFLRLPHHMRQRIEYLAHKEKRSMNDVALDILAVGLFGPLDHVVATEPPAPELTPEVAFAHLDIPVTKEAVIAETPQEKGKPMAAPKPVETKGDDIWTPLASRLKARVNEQNFETWLESVRFLSSDGPQLKLLVPNSFFQGYLTEHYTEVIQEELEAKYRLPYQVEFTVLPEEAELDIAMAPPILVHRIHPLMQIMIDRGVDTIDKLEAVEDDLLPGIYQRRLDEAKRRSGSNEARMAEEVAILKNQRLKEEAARLEFRKRRRAILAASKGAQGLRYKGNPQTHRQYERPSHWSTDGGVNRDDLYKPPRN